MNKQKSRKKGFFSEMNNKELINSLVFTSLKQQYDDGTMPEDQIKDLELLISAGEEQTKEEKGDGPSTVPKQERDAKETVEKYDLK